MATTQTTCSSCHCEGRGWIPGDELMPGKGDASDVFPCYCPCHAKAQVPRERDKAWEAGRADLRRCRMPGCLGHLHPLVPSSTSSASCCVASAQLMATRRAALSTLQLPPSALDVYRLWGCPKTP